MGSQPGRWVASTSYTRYSICFHDTVSGFVLLMQSMSFCKMTLFIEPVFFVGTILFSSSVSEVAAAQLLGGEVFC